MAAVRVAGSLRYENIINVLSQLWAAQAHTLPERYVFPVSTIGSINGKSGCSLPVVDLAGLSSGDPASREEIVRQLGSAASEWGCFQIVNHGIPEKSFEDLYQQAREFFELPVDVKERGEDTHPQGYNGRFTHKSKEAPWMEYLAQYYRPTSELESLAKKVWPEGNSKFCKAVHEYCQSNERLGRRLMELLAESLGLQSDTFSKQFQDGVDYIGSWRLNHYPPCPNPSRSLGAGAHRDIGVLTILKQDTVGGLQVHDGDGFVDVTPVPSALIVIVGNALEAWTNGRFMSSNHRVVVNGRSDRISLVYMFYGPQDFVIQSPPELIDEAHPSLYIPYTYKDFRANYDRLVNSGTYRDSKENLDFALRKQRETGR